MFLFVSVFGRLAAHVFVLVKFALQIHLFVLFTWMERCDIGMCTMQKRKERKVSVCIFGGLD